MEGATGINARGSLMSGGKEVSKLPTRSVIYDLRVSTYMDAV